MKESRYWRTCCKWVARLALQHCKNLLPQPTENFNNALRKLSGREARCVFNSSLHLSCGMEEESSLLAVQIVSSNLLPTCISSRPEALTLQTFNPINVPPCQTPPNAKLSQLSDSSKSVCASSPIWPHDWFLRLGRSHPVSIPARSCTQGPGASSAGMFPQ